MARLCQVKEQLFKFAPNGDCSDYLNLDELLLDLKLSPDALELPVPRYFKEKSRDDDEENQKRDMLEKNFEEHGVPPAPDDDGGSLIPKMTKEQAVRLIQKNERGRQGANRAGLMRELRDEDLARRRMDAGSDQQHDPISAATLIQQHYRGYISRKKTRNAAMEELVFVGMKVSAFSVEMKQRKL